MVSFEPGAGAPAGAALPDFDESGCLPARVPGTAQAALVEAGGGGDPYRGFNTRSLAWIHEREWWWRRSVSIPGAWGGRSVWLELDGVIPSAEVFADGRSVGRAEGAHAFHRIDLTGAVHPGRALLLALRFDPPPVPSSVYPTCQMCYGWDFAPGLNALGDIADGAVVPVGPQGEIRLVPSGPVREVGHPLLAVSRISPEEASGEILLTLAAPGGAPEIEIRGALSPEDASGGAVFLDRTASVAAEGTTDVRIPFRVPNPRLWWPNGLGAPSLYRLTLSVLEGGRESDRDFVDAGLRTLEWIPAEGEADRAALFRRPVVLPQAGTFGLEEGEYPFQPVVNGVPLFLAGADWVPADALLRETPERIGRLVDLARRAHLNMFRVWGGGVREPQGFYEACDRAGILVWHDLWLGNYAEDYARMPRGLFLANVESAARGLRAHPSLALWAGGNELDPRTPSLRAFLGAAGDLLSRVDPGLPYHLTTPWRGDEHQWRVWHQMRPSTDYDQSASAVAFRSEGGLMAPPSTRALALFLPPQDLWPPAPSWAFHNATDNLPNLALTKLLRYVTEYGPPSGVEDLVRKAQEAQAVNAEIFLESMRRRWPRATGALLWQWNEPWPSFSWSVVDWWGNPKPAYFALKRAADPVQASAEIPTLTPSPGSPLTIRLFGENQSGNPLDGAHLVGEIVSAEGSVLAAASSTLALPPGTVVEGNPLAWTVPPAPPRGIVFVRVSFEARGIARETSYALGIAPPGTPDPYAPLLSLPPADLGATLALDGTLCVENRGGGPAFQVSVDPVPSGDTDDSAFTLFGRTTRCFALRGARGALLAAWNAPERKVSALSLTPPCVRGGP